MKGNVRATAATVVTALALAGCNVVNVKQALPNDGLGLVCIIHNPAVRVDDFVDVLRDGFARHGVPSSVVSATAGPECGSTVTYTARRSWDFAPYLAMAKVDIWKGGLKVGGLSYEHNNGLSLVKWQSTASKMDPLIDQMLAQATPGAEALATPAPAAAQQPKPEAQPSPSPSPTSTQQSDDCKACATIGRKL